MCNFDPKASESCENLNLSNAGYYKVVVGNILLQNYFFSLARLRGGDKTRNSASELPKLSRILVSSDYHRHER